MSNSNPWTPSEIKAFDRGYADFIVEPDRWEQIAERIPSRSMEEILEYKEKFEDDLAYIKTYPAEAIDFTDEFSIQHPAEVTTDPQKITRRNIHNRGEKRSLWTNEEQRLFLAGLNSYGKGQWKRISRDFLPSKTPSQIASHAQKYYLRLNDENKPKKRKRASIHDLTLKDDDANALEHQQNGVPPPPALIPQIRVVDPPMNAPQQQQSSPQPGWVSVPPRPPKVPPQLSHQQNFVPVPPPSNVVVPQGQQLLESSQVQPQVFYSPYTYHPTHLDWPLDNVTQHHQMGDDFMHFNDGF